MNKKITFTKVTWYSQIAAIVIFVGVFYLGFYVGQQYEMVSGAADEAPLTVNTPAVPNIPNVSTKPIGDGNPVKLVNNVTFMCPAVSMAAQFFEPTNSSTSRLTSQSYGPYGYVDLELSDGRVFSLPQTVSADGARYANPSGSFVFWNKGIGAFIEENGTTTYSGCVIQQ